MTPIRRISIRAKLIAMMLATTATALLVVTSLMTWYEADRYTIAREQDLDAQTVLLAASSIAALRFADEQTAAENLSVLRFRERVTSAALYDADGTLFATWRRDGSAGPPFPVLPESEGITFEGDQLWALRRVVHDGAVLGTAYIHSRFGVYERLRNYLVIAALAGLLALAVATLIAARLQRAITHPISLINRAAREVVEQRSYEGRAEKVTDDEIGTLADSFNVMLDELQALNQDLERRIAERTGELERSNQELEAFSYTVSHDLRSPLRAITGFAQALRARLPEPLDPESVEYFERIRSAIRRMGQRIDGLLDLAHLSRRPLSHADVDLGAFAAEVVAELRQAEPDRDVEVTISDDLRVTGDPQLLRALVENLVENAWKFTRGAPVQRIEVGARDEGGHKVYVVRDSGAGFDMQFVDKLFHPFQRVHAVSEFPGTGIGLATAKRIIDRHGGRIWVDAAPGQGASFQFTLESEGDL